MILTQAGLTLIPFAERCLDTANECVIYKRYIHIGVGTGAQTLVVGTRNLACLGKWDAVGYKAQWPVYVLQMITFELFQKGGENGAGVGMLGERLFQLSREQAQ